MPLTWTKLQPLLYLSEEGPTSLMFPIHQQSWFSQSRESRTQSGNISNLSIFTSFIIIWSFSSQHDNRPHILNLMPSSVQPFGNRLLGTLLKNTVSIKSDFITIRDPLVGCHVRSFSNRLRIISGAASREVETCSDSSPQPIFHFLETGKRLCFNRYTSCTARSWSFPLAKSPWVIQVRWSLWENHPGRVNTPWTLGKALGE